ncbi:MAG: flavodoxin family protein, partial [Desulfotomaculales bacterium]
MDLKCLALACSPRKKGNTAWLARQALEECGRAGGETELLYLADFRYAPCRACGGCNATGRCVVRDDAGLIFEKILAADRIILAAPIFSMGICAQAKMLIDRAQQFWAAKYLLKRSVLADGEKNRPARRGIFVSCAGTRLPGVFDGAVQVARYFFKMLDVDLLAVLCYSGVDKEG